MKKTIITLFGLALSLWAFAWTSPVEIPDLSNARLRIVAQNAENYVSNLEASNSPCKTQEEFEAKTTKMANAFLALNADIVAMCEVQADDEILSYIVNKMNELYGQNVYTYVSDNINIIASAGNYQSLKAGFIYRTDKVTPYRSIVSPYYSGEYYRRMRIQAFKENSTNEIFILSMNHFKAKDSSSDAGESTRITNAAELIDKLDDLTYDKDILIMGDLNAYMGETPINNLQNAGYAEQLVRYDRQAYTYIYRGNEGILDHCMANSTMEAQIVGAYAYHINTYGLYAYKYSDHDAVVVGLNLGETVDGFETISTTSKARKILRNGQLLIELEGQVFTITGTRIE